MYEAEITIPISQIDPVKSVLYLDLYSTSNSTRVVSNKQITLNADNIYIFMSSGYGTYSVDWQIIEYL